MVANLMIVLGVVVAIVALGRTFRSPLQPQQQPPWSLIALAGLSVMGGAGWLNWLIWHCIWGLR